MFYYCFYFPLTWKVQGELLPFEFTLDCGRATWVMNHSCGLISHLLLCIQITGQCACLILTWLCYHYTPLYAFISVSCWLSLHRARPVEPTAFHPLHDTLHSVAEFVALVFVLLLCLVPFALWLQFAIWNELLLLEVSLICRYHIILAASVTYRLIQQWQGRTDVARIHAIIIILHHQLILSVRGWSYARWWLRFPFPLLLVS